MKYQPALDGLRALAVLGVIVAHTSGPFGGLRGVDVFFVLSGFLITSILLRQPELTEFYIKRARRLFPALFVFLAAYLLAAPFLFPKDRAWQETLFALFYSHNWLMAFDYRQSGLGHLWSLSVEEQFYLLWPLLLVGLRRTTTPLVWLGAAWITLTITRDIWPSAQQAYYITPLHATGLIVGAMAAIKLPSSRFGWPALLVILVVFTFGGSRRGMWDLPLIEIATAFLISALLQPSRLTTAFSFPPLVFIGFVSYGIYLWHLPLAQATRDHWWSLPLTLSFSVCLAALSYYFVERRFRRQLENSQITILPSEPSPPAAAAPVVAQTAPLPPPP